MLWGELFLFFFSEIDQMNSNTIKIVSSHRSEDFCTSGIKLYTLFQCPDPNFSRVNSITKSGCSSSSGVFLAFSSLSPWAMLVCFYQVIYSNALSRK